MTRFPHALSAWADPLLNTGTGPRGRSPLEGGYCQETTWLVRRRAVEVTSSSVCTYHGTPQSGDVLVQEWPGKPPEYP
jgi:hypothetical protein